MSSTPVPTLPLKPTEIVHIFDGSERKRFVLSDDVLDVPFPEEDTNMMFPELATLIRKVRNALIRPSSKELRAAYYPVLYLDARPEAKAKYAGREEEFDTMLLRYFKSAWPNFQVDHYGRLRNEPKTYGLTTNRPTLFQHSPILNETLCLAYRDAKRRNDPSETGKIERLEFLLYVTILHELAHCITIWALGVEQGEKERSPRYLSFQATATSRDDLLADVEGEAGEVLELTLIGGRLSHVGELSDPQLLLIRPKLRAKRIGTTRDLIAQSEIHRQLEVAPFFDHVKESALTTYRSADSRSSSVDSRA